VERLRKGTAYFWPDTSITDFSSLMSEAADRISTLERELDEALRYATHLLTSYVNKYCDPVPEWAPLPDLIGVLTQIDNASTVTADILARAEAAEAKVARMGEALKPFAEAAALVEYSDDNGWAGAWMAASDALHLIPRVKHLRAARSALQSEKDREGGDD
jgi:hypothetical protein